MKNHLDSLHQAMTTQASFDGQYAQLVTLQNSKGMSVSFMDIGATWLSCYLPVDGEYRELLLRSSNMIEHMQQSAYFGSVVGRFANRIANGQFKLDGQTYQLGLNDGEHSLHGGIDGFDKRRWSITEQSAQRVIFTLHSADGDQGYPGNLDASVTYSLDEDNAVSIVYQASCDKACPVNLSNHAYFNLAGEASHFTSLDHHLQLNASYYLPTDAALIPSGEMRTVLDSSFDFTALKTIGQDFLSEAEQQLAGGYDHAFVFMPKVTDALAVAALLHSPQRDLTMKVRTTKPALQFYSGNFLDNTPGATKNYPPYHGLALETQFFPDGPNHPEWGDKNGIIKPNQHYLHQTVYQFETHPTLS